MTHPVNLPARLTHTDLEPAAQVFAQAFEQDPLWVHILPDLGQRRKSLAELFRGLLTISIANRQAYGCGDPLAGVAVWSSPGEPASTFPLAALAPFSRLLFSRFTLTAFKAVKIFTKFEALRRRYASEPHYYLQTIGVRPAAQGQGMAAHLIRPFLAQADQHQMSAYTETVTPANVSLYEHFGFKCVEEYAVPGTNLRQWAFFRPSGG